jgi:hypothetical protein
MYFGKLDGSFKGWKVLNPNYNYKPVEQSKQTSAFHIFKNPAAIATGLEPNINTQMQRL